MTDVIIVMSRGLRDAGKRQWGGVADFESGFVMFMGSGLGSRF